MNSEAFAVDLANLSMAGRVQLQQLAAAYAQASRDANNLTWPQSRQAFSRSLLEPAPQHNSNGHTTIPGAPEHPGPAPHQDLSQAENVPDDWPAGVNPPGQPMPHGDGPFFPIWDDMRAGLHLALATSAENCVATGNALVTMADTFAATDADAAARFESKVDARLAGPDERPPVVPEIKHEGDPIDTQRGPRIKDVDLDGRVVDYTTWEPTR